MPDDILHSFLDYLPFEDQFTVLAVSTRCRAAGMEHPFYWKMLYMDLDGLSESALQGAINHLSRRLAYAEDRHVEVALSWSDPRRVMDLVLSHISHIVFLELTGVDMLIGQSVLDALNQSAAPILHQLRLLFDGTPNGVPISNTDQRPCLGSGLFKSSAPSLRDLKLANVDFPAEFPKALGALTSLTNDVVLMLSGRFVFAPEFHDAQAHAWRRVRLLMVMSRITSQSVRFPWHSWVHTSSLVASFVGVNVAIAVLDHLSGPLRLLADIQATREEGSIWAQDFRLSATTNDNDSDDLREPSAGGHFWRTITGPVPRPDNARDAQYAGGLLAVAACAARFVRLTLPLAQWNRLAAHVHLWPALRGLRLLLRAGFVRNVRDPMAVECPALERVLLSPKDAARPARIILNEFAAFADVAIRGASLPMGLACEKGVWTARVPPDETLKRVFCPWRQRSAHGSRGGTSA